MLRNCGYLRHFDTVYVIAAWWESCLQMKVPREEKLNCCLFRPTQTRFLQGVHPTWAGTFVLAALGAFFPSITFILLDSDCLPITLFEVADLWQEAYLAVQAASSQKESSVGGESGGGVHPRESWTESNGARGAP